MTEPGKVIFACDESGAKDYANQDEQYPGEVGVCGGVLVPCDYPEEKLAPFHDLIAKYPPPTGKLHIADLPGDQKEALRRDLYAAALAIGLPCFWYAILSCGLPLNVQRGATDA